MSRGTDAQHGQWRHASSATCEWYQRHDHHWKKTLACVLHDFLYYKRNIPWVGQTDIRLSVLPEANLAQEAGVFRCEGVVTLVELVVSTVKCLNRICEYVGARPVLGAYDVIRKGRITSRNA